MLMCVDWLLDITLNIGNGIVLYSLKVQWIINPNTQNQYFAFNYSQKFNTILTYSII